MSAVIEREEVFERADIDGAAAQLLEALRNALAAQIADAASKLPALVVTEIPPVCLIEDIARIFKTSRRNIDRMRAARVFPIPELPTIDNKARWSGELVRQWLATNGAGVKRKSWAA